MAEVLDFTVTENTGGLTATFQDKTIWIAMAALESNLTITQVDLDTYTLMTPFPVIDLLALFGVPGANTNALLNSTYFGKTLTTEKIDDAIYQFKWDVVNDEAGGEIPYQKIWYGYFEKV